MSFIEYFTEGFININHYTETPISFDIKFDNQKNLDVIVSRFAENIDDWITKFDNLYLYDKNKLDNESHYKSIHNCKYKKLDNVGRCDHSYLYHIIHNYDNLNDMNLFLPASFRKNNYKVILLSAMIQASNKNPNQSIFFNNNYSILQLFHSFVLTHHRTTSLDNRSENDDIYETAITCETPYLNWFVKNFGETDSVLGSFGGIVLVNKKDILSRPKEFYMNLIKYLDSSNNPLAGHYIERSWPVIFNIKNENGFLFKDYRIL